MKRLLNVRPAMVLAVAAGIGAGVCYASVRGGWTYYCLIGIVPITAAFVITFIVKRSVKGIVLTVAALLVCLACALGVYFRLNAYADTSVENGYGYQISGTVYEKGTSSYGSYIKLKGLSVDGSSVDGRMYVYLDDQYSDSCEVGYTVSFTGSVYAYNAFAYGGVSANRLIEDLRYTAYLSSDFTSEYGFSLFGAANSALRNLFENSSDEDISAIAYAMLTGNTEYVEDGTLNSFRYGGVAHVFAVSGLHIGLVYAFVCYVLKKLRVNRYISSAISISLIFIYSGICGFTISSLRAAIMCTVSSVLNLFGGKYDLLSSVCISFTLLTLINPLNILSVGFQLSITAVAGIALFAPQISRLLRKIKIPQKISSAASVSLSAQIATFPILLSTFGYVSWASLFLNIVFVPVLSAIFTLLFGCTLLALIIAPAAQFLISIPLAPLGAVCSLLLSSGAETALISGFSFGAFVPLYYLAVLCLSQRINLKIPLRAALSVTLAGVLAACVILRNYVPDGAVKIVVSAYYGDSYAVLIRTSEGTVLIISETPSSYDISSLLQDCAVSSPDAVIILGGDESAFAYNLLGVECDTLYVYYENIPVQPYLGVTINYLQSFSVAGIDFTYISGYDVLASFNGFTVGVSTGGVVQIERCDLLISSAEAGSCVYGTQVFFGEADTTYSAYTCGDLIFTYKNGKLYYID